jgi:hypothetical protein
MYELTPKKFSHAQHDGECAMDFLRRVVSQCNYEYDTILEQLPTPAAVIEFFELQHHYDTEFLSGIMQQILHGASPIRYNEFVQRHNLDWTILPEKKQPSQESPAA